MEFDDTLGAGVGMQAVDVLGDDRGRKLGEHTVANGRAGLPSPLTKPSSHGPELLDVIETIFCAHGAFELRREAPATVGPSEGSQHGGCAQPGPR